MRKLVGLLAALAIAAVGAVGGCVVGLSADYSSREQDFGSEGALWGFIIGGVIGSLLGLHVLLNWTRYDRSDGGEE